MSVQTESTSPARGRVSPLRHFVAVGVLSLLVSLPFLGRPALFDPDEGYYPASAMEMLARGDWLDPVFNGEPRWGKPVGIYFLQCLSISVLGKNELAARLPSAAMALAFSLLCLSLGARLYGRRTGLHAGLAAAAMLQSAVYARAAVPDMLLALGVLVALWGFAGSGLGERGFGEAWRSYLALYLGCALGFLAKGPLGAILPGLTVFLFFVLSRDWRGMARLGLVRGAVIFLAAAAPWFIWMYNRHGMSFITEIFLNRNIQHYFTDRWQHEGPLYYYLPVLLAGTFPWTAALAGGLARTFGAVKAILAGKLSGQESRSGLFLWCWLFGMLVFFSFSRAKLPNYVLPLYPALTVLAGRFMADLEEGVSRRARLLFGWGTALAALAALAAGLIILPRKVHVDAGLVLLALSPLALIAAAGLALRRRPNLWAAAAAIGMAALLSLTTGAVLPRVEKLNAVRELAAFCPVSGQDSGRVLFHRCWAPSFLFYSGRQAVRFDPEREDIRDYLERDVRWVLTRERDIQEAVELAGYQPSMVHLAGGRALLRFEPPVMLTAAGLP